LATLSIKTNEARALTVLFRRGPMTRAELARALGLTRSTTGNLVQVLIESGLVREQAEGNDESETRVGRPGILVGIDGDGAYFLGADIGVDRIEALAVDLAGTVRARVGRAYNGQGSDPVKTLAVMIALISEVVAKLPSPDRIQGLSVAIPGFPTADGATHHAVILGWHELPLAQLLAEAFDGDVPILLENDANAFAVAETYRWTGENHDPEDVLVVLIENGLGGGIISGGRLHRGLLRGAGEIGHMPIGEEGFVFDAVRPGRLESYVGKHALLARDAYRTGSPRSLDRLLAALAEGEPLARLTAEEWGKWLARGLTAVVCMLEPQRIIIGGSVGAVYPFVADRIEAAVRAALVEGYPMPLIQTAAADVNRPALGAAYLMHQAMLANETMMPPPGPAGAGSETGAS
jgi:predicted NBD/HSP70 family sugar kinase